MFALKNNMMWFEMHKHTNYSLFDGFDNLKSIVGYAKELGFPAMAISDHGNTFGVAKLYFECMKQGIKPILGTEVYFRPVFEKINERFHSCIYAKNFNGYQNMMQIVTKANTENFHYKGVVTLEVLSKYKDDIIITSGCLVGYIPQAILKGKFEQAIKMTKVMKKMFGDDFYFEIMPFKTIMDEKDKEKYIVPNQYNGDLQRYVNDELFKLSEEYDVKCIPTTDSHFTRPKDWPTYKLMHKMNGTKYDVDAVYNGRHMQSVDDIINRMKTTGISKENGFKMLENLYEIYNKVDDDIFVGNPFENAVPDFDENSYEIIKEKCVQALKDSGRYNKKYCNRVKTEIEVLKAHNINDYFLIVEDYVKYAESIDCYVGPGRGSVCASLIAELLGITDVDPVEIGNDFDRFLRLDKKKMPDIDLDFENDKRGQVIDYLLDKYEGRAAQVLTFGYYKSRNLCNDLVKYFQMDDDDSIIFKKEILKRVKDSEHASFEKIDVNDLLAESDLRYVNSKYACEYGTGIVEHFAKLFGHIKYVGTHAAGVLITKGEIGSWCSIAKTKSGYSACFDKYDVEALGLLKFDILGLRTLDMIHDIENFTGDYFDRKKIDPEKMIKVYEAFADSETTGVFQCNSNTARKIFNTIFAHDIQDIIAGISLNRPATLMLKMHETYAENKKNPPLDAPWYEYTKDAYGTIIYQEHVQKICKGIAHMSNADADKLAKGKSFSVEDEAELRSKFVNGAMKYSSMSEAEANELFDGMLLYMFNKGHASGYAFISEWQMYHKVYNPVAYWFSSLKYVKNDPGKEWQMKKEAVKSGSVIFLAHVNYTSEYSLRKEDGELVIQEGLLTIKGVGAKGAELIEEERKKNGPFKSKAEFLERCQGRAVTTATIRILDEYGALEFNKKRYISRVIKFNSNLYV